VVTGVQTCALPILITNEYMGLTGYVEIPDRSICFDTGLTQVELDTCKKELSPKALFQNEWINLVNLQKYDPIEGENNNLWKAHKKELDSVPEGVIKSFEGGMKGLLSPSEGCNGIGKVMVKEEGGVGGTKQFSSLAEVTPKVLEDLASEKHISVKDVESTFNQMSDWIESKGKTYKNYKAGLRNWINRKMEEGKIHKLPNIAESKIKPMETLTAEERRINLARISELRLKFGGLQ
jgi:hypothetical protein